MPSTTSAPPPQRNQQPPSITLLVYPLTLLLGSLFSILSPTAQSNHSNHSDPLLPSLASDINLPHPPQETPVNYFARKNNIFNLYFVKIGWLWTTLAFVSLLVFHPPPSLSSTSAQNPKRLAQALLRFTLATIAWYLTTQWFFGPPIIDRGFILTGGKCMKAYHHQAHGGGYESGTKHLEEMLTGAACKAAGGDWKGGHDVSGHVFMLVLATAVLGFEAVGAGVRVFGMCFGTGEGEGVKEKADSGDSDSMGSADADGGLRVWSGRFVVGVIALGWWMLFMTSIWFHTWLEKWSGLLIALGAVYIIYLLPRSLGFWRNIVGVPGLYGLADITVDTQVELPELYCTEWKKVKPS